VAVVAGNVSGERTSPRTVLEQLLWQEDATYEEIAARFEQVAADLGEKATLSPRHLRRLASGERSGTTPATRRVLRVMFARPVEVLLAPAMTARIGEGGACAPVRLLDGVDQAGLAAAAARAHAFVIEMSSSNVSGESMDQLYDDVAALAASYQRQAPVVVAGRLATTQQTLFTLLEGRQPLAQTRRLLLLAGVTGGLLAKIAHDLGDPHTAMTQARTAFLCADNADHDGMRAWIRGLQSLIAYWAGRYHEAVRYAQHGAEFAAHGTTSVWLPANEARAWAALGNPEQAQAAIDRGQAARATSRPDEIDELGGLCTFSAARQLYYAADALVWLPDLARQAQARAEQAVAAYADPDAPDWAFGDAAGSATDLAVARIRRGDLDGATAALEPVLALPAEQRINGIVTSVRHVYTALTGAPAAAGARELAERIEDFTATPVRALGA
jgi:tetratricopeptide (TPR) repeat protein